MGPDEVLGSSEVLVAVTINGALLPEAANGPDDLE
jgi:hypothetical protein